MEVKYTKASVLLLNVIEIKIDYYTIHNLLLLCL